MDSIALSVSACTTVGFGEHYASGQENTSAAPNSGLSQRDRLAYDVYQSVLHTGRGEWIELMNCAPLASQYHLSTYSKLKFGLEGV